jgi:hypothetical protein
MLYSVSGLRSEDIDTSTTGISNGPLVSGNISLNGMNTPAENVRTGNQDTSAL